MTVLVIGGSGSGKSAYAENALLKLADESECKKYYIATMKIYDDEMQRKVDRHREFRCGKGFITIEKEIDIHKAFEGIEIGQNRAVLLECVTNLAANEMFSDNGIKSERLTADKIIRDIKALSEKLTYLVIVSGNIFEDGISGKRASYDEISCDGASYDKTTLGYIRALGRINREIAEIADEVVEVVAGIPVVIKQKEFTHRGLCQQ